MGRKRKKSHGVPRATRMTRPARLQSAVSWLKKFDGRNVLRGYCKHYGVDWRCAAIELQQLGIPLDADYLEARERSERQLINVRKRRCEECDAEHYFHHPIEYESLLDAYLAEDFPALHAMECDRDGIDPETG